MALIGFAAAVGTALVAKCDSFPWSAERSVAPALHNYLMPGTADYQARIAMATEALVDLRLEPDANLTPEQRLHRFLNKPGDEFSKRLLAMNITVRDLDREDTALLQDALIH